MRARARAIFSENVGVLGIESTIDLKCAASSSRAFRVDGGASARDRSMASLTGARD